LNKSYPDCELIFSIIGKFVMERIQFFVDYEIPLTKSNVEFVMA